MPSRQWSYHGGRFGPGIHDEVGIIGGTLQNPRVRCFPCLAARSRRWVTVACRTLRSPLPATGLMSSSPASRQAVTFSGPARLRGTEGGPRDQAGCAPNGFEIVEEAFLWQVPKGNRMAHWSTEMIDRQRYPEPANPH